MSRSITRNEEQIIQLILDGICLAPHSMRQQLFRQAHYKAVECGFNGWALMSRGFDLLIDEQYDLFNETLWEELENRSFDGQAEGQGVGYEALRMLLFAHAHRRRAGGYMDDYETTVYEDRGEIRKKIRRELAKASRLYRSLAELGRNDRIRAVATHGLGKLVYLRVQHESLFRHHPEIKSNLTGRLKRSKRYHKASVAIAEQAGFDYAPPMNAIAKIELIEYEKNYRNWDKRTRIKHLESCLSWANRAIQASQQTYALPLLLKAGVQHTLRLETGEPLDREETADLISRAVALSPYDSIVQSDLESFSRMLQKDVEAGLIEQEFYRLIKFARPAKAMEESLNQYLVGEDKPNSATKCDQLLILRRWSSYTPLIRLKEHSTMGGGYLVEWNGKRIAIDPGVGFIQNLHQFGYRVQDLDALVITHQHIDHADDTEAILSILKTYNKIQEARSSSARKIPRFLLTESGRERWMKMIVSALDLKHPDEIIETLQPSSSKSASTCIDGIGIRPVPLHSHQDAIDEVEGDEDGGRPPTGCGLVLELPQRAGRIYKIGITSDTGYLSEPIKEGGRRIRASEYYQDCGTVVLHLSTVDDLDDHRVIAMNMDKFVEHDAGWGEEVGCPNLFYRKHLGFWGVVSVIRDLIVDSDRSDRTIILSEFGEEMLRRRVAILDEVRQVIESLGRQGKEQAKRIYVGDIGTQIRLPEGTIGCHLGHNSCRKVADYLLEFDTCPGDLSIPHRDWSDRMLVYLCSEHAHRVGSPYGAKAAVWGYPGHLVNSLELRGSGTREG